jgi:hypothetical protein
MLAVYRPAIVAVEPGAEGAPGEEIGQRFPHASSLAEPRPGGSGAVACEQRSAAAWSEPRPGGSGAVACERRSAAAWSGPRPAGSGAMACGQCRAAASDDLGLPWVG